MRRGASAIQIVQALESIAVIPPNSKRLLRIVDHLRRGCARFKPGAYLLQARSKRFNLLLLVRELGLNTRFMVPFFPRSGYLSANAGLEGGEEPSGKEVLRLIQIRLAPPSL